MLTCKKSILLSNAKHTFQKYMTDHDHEYDDTILHGGRVVKYLVMTDSSDTAVKYKRFIKETLDTAEGNWKNVTFIDSTTTHNTDNADVFIFTSSGCSSTAECSAKSNWGWEGVSHIPVPECSSIFVEVVEGRSTASIPGTLTGMTDKCYRSADWLG